MKLKLLLPALSIISLTSLSLKAQTERPDKLYTMSGIGSAIPIGETANYLSPKFSTSLGVNLGLGNKGLFLYPKVSLHAFRVDQIRPDEGYTYALKNSRGTTYLLNLGLGYRKIVSKWAFYGFAGAGGGFILTPQARVDTQNSQILMDNKTNGMAMFEGGGGIEYKVGGVNLFIESSVMIGFSDIQSESFHTVPITVGIKPNLSKLLRKK